MSNDNIKFRLKEKDFVIYYDSEGNPAFRIQREKLKDGREYHRAVFIDDDIKRDKLYMERWLSFEDSNNLKKEDSEIDGSKKKNSKHTGGKPPYLMLMINEIESLRETDVKNVEELIGYVVCLGKHIEWNTGRLVKNKRRKKHESLQYKDMLGIFKCSNGKLAKTINQLKDIGLLEYKEVDREKAYYISSKYIKKGNMKDTKEE